MAIILDDLKTREIEILRLMAQELSNREIAERLHIGVETVRWYAKQIYSKLHVSGRDQAAEKALELGLLDQQIQSPEPDIATPEHNLPSQFTPFIGRESVIASILEMFKETRLLTLTGVGGTGKTRLSLRIGEELLSQFQQGVTFVDLATIRQAEQVPDAIAEALDVFDSGNAPLVEILKRALADQHLLLILDNYEHVLDAVHVVTALLGAAPHLKILATSREPLRLSGEQIYAVPPLTLPPDNPASIKALEQSEAVTLFVQRAQNVRNNFQLAQSNADDVVTICQRLDGLPLAIELAAASSRLLSPSAIVQRLDDRFRVLRSGSRDAPQRHQTLRATIDWSYSLLNQDEKTLLARLAVFQGGCSLEAIEAICSHDLSIDILDAMASLVDKSLVRLEEDESGEPRFMFLETIYEYATERLAESGEQQDIYRRHARYFVELAEQLREQFLETATLDEYRKLDTEFDNLRALISWSLFGQEVEWGLRLVCALDGMWVLMGHHVEAQRWLDKALKHRDALSPLFEARIIYTAGVLAFLRQEQEKSRDYLSQALELFEELDATDYIGVTLSFVSLTNIGLTDDYETAIALARKGLTVSQEGSSRYNIAIGFHFLFVLLNLARDYEQAQLVAVEQMNFTRESGITAWQGLTLGQMAVTALGQGNPDQAHALIEQAIEFLYNSDLIKYYVAGNIKRMAGVYTLRKQFKKATQIMGAAQAYLDARIMPWHADEQQEVNRMLATLHENMDDASYQQAWNEGRQMSLDEAVAYALLNEDED